MSRKPAEDAVVSEVGEIEMPLMPIKTTVAVRGRSAMPATSPDNVKYGHWRAGVHWSGTEQTSADVNIEQLDELKADPNLALTYDATEEQIVRATVAPDIAARRAAIEAAELEAQAAAKLAEAKMLRAQAEAQDAVLKARDARAKINAMREGVVR